MNYTSGSPLSFVILIARFARQSIDHLVHYFAPLRCLVSRCITPRYPALASHCHAPYCTAPHYFARLGLYIDGINARLLFIMVMSHDS